MNIDDDALVAGAPHTHVVEVTVIGAYQWIATLADVKTIGLGIDGLLDADALQAVVQNNVPLEQMVRQSMTTILGGVKKNVDFVWKPLLVGVRRHSTILVVLLPAFRH